MSEWKPRLHWHVWMLHVHKVAVATIATPHLMGCYILSQMLCRFLYSTSPATGE